MDTFAISSVTEHKLVRIFINIVVRSNVFELFPSSIVQKIIKILNDDMLRTARTFNWEVGGISKTRIYRTHEAFKTETVATGLESIRKPIFVAADWATAYSNLAFRALSEFLQNITYILFGRL